MLQQNKYIYSKVRMSYSKFIIIIPTKTYLLYRVYKNNHINSFNINN